MATALNPPPSLAPPPGQPANVLVPPPSDPNAPGTVVDLGRKIKAKYPEYSHIDDAELGRRIQAKYPEYANFTDVPGGGFAPLHISGALSGPPEPSPEGPVHRTIRLTAEKMSLDNILHPLREAENLAGQGRIIPNPDIPPAESCPSHSGREPASSFAGADS